MGPSAPASGSEDIDYPLHDHEQIEARLGELRLSGFSPEDAAFFANGLISFCRNAEEALAECIQHLDESTLSRELAARVFTDWRRRSSPNESQADLRHRILAELKARQIVVVASDEWSVALPDGTQPPLCQRT